jgi:large subunit ribosomal protein L28
MLHRRRNITYPQKLPPYPYGVNQRYKASNLGLYGGARIASGNNVSEKTKTKTRRRWYPNVHNKKLWSRALNKYIKVKVTTRVLRTIDKVGGLDEYLVGGKTARLKELGLKGWVLRWQVMQTPWYGHKRLEEAKALGLSKEDLKESKERNAAFMESGEWQLPEMPSQQDVEAVVNAIESDEAIDLTDGQEAEELEAEEEEPFMVEQPVSEPVRIRA